MSRHTRKIFANELIALLTIVSFCAFAARGQSDEARKCPAVGSDVPFLSQMSLGMTPAEISKVLSAPIQTEPKKPPL